MGVVIQKGRQERLERPGQPDLSRVLELYPEYYKHFLEAQHCLMAGDGALPRQSRHYIAFLAIRYDITTTTSIITAVLFAVTLAVTP